MTALNTSSIRTLSSDAPNRTRSNAGAERHLQIGAAIDLSGLGGKRHLDVGCDTGDFALTAAQMWGTIPTGVDVAHRPAQEAARRRVDAHCCSLEDAPAHLTDLSVLTAIDVVEHIVEPQRFMAEVKRRLMPGGVAYIETPNVASHIYSIGRMLLRATGGRPRFVFTRLFPPEHVQYFSRVGLEAIAKDAGLDVISLDTRSIPISDIGASLAVCVATAGIQALDWAAGSAVLLCMVARRPS
jgi:cyclopropane fatty-acyl-phospholipid synthase-like methyltransferase